jgi:hypothetical protein
MEATAVSGPGHGVTVPLFISAACVVRPVTGAGCGATDDGDADSSLAVPVERITEIRLIRKSEMRLGDGAAAMSALTGSDDEVYDLTPLECAERVRAIQKFFLYHPSEP